MHLAMKNADDHQDAYLLSVKQTNMMEIQKRFVQHMARIAKPPGTSARHSRTRDNGGNTVGENTMIRKIGVASLVTLMSVGSAYAAVTAEEAKRLQGDLTPWGAERAGNADGSIPAWTGGWVVKGDPVKPGQHRPDVHPEDKVVVSISAKNMAEHKDRLTPNLMALMQKYPDFRIDVYPTRRTTAYPEWAYEQTALNAIRTKLTNGGHAVEDVFGGVPFPIPQSAMEVLWNATMRFTMPEFEYSMKNWAMTASGERILLSALTQRYQSPIFDPNNTLENYKKGGRFFTMGRSEYTAPPVKNGEMQLIRLPDDSLTYKNDIWQYLAGQRRLRKAPNLNYDAPNPNTSGMANIDESYGLTGPFDRFDVKLVGKQELYIPANNNNLVRMGTDAVLQPKFPNPDNIRWERRRVWVLELKTKADQRNTVPHRVAYIDEDSWNFAVVDAFSADGTPWKVTYMLQYVMPEYPVTGWAGYFGINLQNGSYIMEGDVLGSPKPMNLAPVSPATYYTPEALAAAGVR